MNAAQRAAVHYLDGPCLVIAGAGSGKTRVITAKLKHLIDSGFESRAIAAITFTNKAAAEMAARLKTQIKLRGDAQPLVSTFHSLGVQILRAEARALGLRASFSIVDADDATAILTQVLGTTDRAVARSCAQRISLWKNAGLDCDQALAQAGTDEQLAAARAYRDYQATLKAYQSVDFDDLIALPMRLFAGDAQARERWQNRLRYLLIDEYQDTNICQYELIKLLAGPRAAFTAVGDDDQSIYAWRGATLENLARLGQDYPQLRVIKLEQNYRSSVRILNAANALIGNNPKLHDKKLWSELGMGDAVTVHPAADEQAEADDVVARLQAHRFERKTQWRDYAVLYRGNHQAKLFEQVLRRERIPYQLSGGQSFFERAEVKDLCAYLRLLANDDDDPAFIRAVTTPKRGIGNQSLTALGEYAGTRQSSLFAALFEDGAATRIGARQLELLREFGQFINRIAYRAVREPARQVLDDLIAAIDYRAYLFDAHDDKQAGVRWDNVSEFADWIGRRGEEDGKNLIELAQTIALISRLDGGDSSADAVRLSTIHAAKGLEFAHVVIVGVEEGWLPHHGSALDGDEDEAPARIEEERRLMYVAVTRAQRTLQLSWCKTRRGRVASADGARKAAQIDREPSRFIAEMKLQAAPDAVTTSAQQGKARLAGLKALLATPRPTPPDL